MPKRRHTRLSRPDVEVDSPLIECRLIDLSTAGLGFETDIGLRLGVPYPFRLRDGDQILAIEAVVCWCRLVRNQPFEGGFRPVYRAGASFVDWSAPAPTARQSTLEDQIDSAVPAPTARQSTLEDQIDSAVDQWIELNRTSGPDSPGERTIVHRAPRRRG